MPGSGTASNAPVHADVSRRPLPRVSTENTLSTPSRSEEKTIRPSSDQTGDSSLQGPEVSWVICDVPRSSRKRFAAPWMPSAVRSEAKTTRLPSGLGLGSRSWNRSEVSGRSAPSGDGDAIEIGDAALGESADDDSVAVGQPVWRQQGDQLEKLIARSHAVTLQVPDDHGIAVTVPRGEEEVARAGGIHARVEGMKRFELRRTTAGQNRMRLPSLERLPVDGRDSPWTGE